MLTQSKHVVFLKMKIENSILYDQLLKYLHLCLYGAHESFVCIFPIYQNYF